MGARSPSCNCCGSTCEISSAAALAQQTSWQTIVGGWDAATGVLSGTGATAITITGASGPQWVMLNVTASKPGQVLDILLGCDAAGIPDVFARLTFGDSLTPGSCGSIQLFENAIALELPQPLPSLVAGSQVSITICADAALRRLFVSTPAGFGANVQTGSTAILAADPSGRLGLRLTTDQADSIGIVFPALGGWDRIFIAGQTCKDCKICGTSIERWVHVAPASSTCVHTLSGPYVKDSVEQGMANVASLAIISALDRERGHSISAHAVTNTTTAAGVVVDVNFDNGHHVARLTISAVTAGPCPGGDNSWHVDTYVQLLKNGVVIATGTTLCRSVTPDVSGTFVTFQLWAGFCDGDAFAAYAILGNFIDSISVASAQIAGGSVHGATVTGEGGVSLFQATRCAESVTLDEIDCAQCETCEDVERDRAWQVVIAASDPSWNGTFILPADSVAPGYGTNPCRARYTIDSSKHLTVRQERSHIAFEMRDTFGVVVASGKSTIPRTDCAAVVNDVITFAGSVTGTAAVTAL